MQPRRHPGSRDLCERKNRFEAVVPTTTGKEHEYFVLFLMLQPLSHDIPGFLAPWQPCGCRVMDLFRVTNVEVGIH